MTFQGKRKNHQKHGRGSDSRPVSDHFRTEGEGLEAASPKRCGAARRGELPVQEVADTWRNSARGRGRSRKSLSRFSLWAFREDDGPSSVQRKQSLELLFAFEKYKKKKKEKKRFLFLANPRVS